MTRKASDLLGYYKSKGDFEWEGSYNIAPTQRVPVVVEGTNGREIRLMKWGLLPHWAKDEKIAYNMINARGETLEDKAGFRDAFKKSRCIIPATGFYEWQRITYKIKMPYYFTPNDGLFSFCGLWSSWKSPTGQVLETCAIITTAANQLVARVHDRMPVAVNNNVIGAWLAAGTKADELKSFLTPYPASQMKSFAVTQYVNSVKNQGPKCVEALNLTDT